jgi:hypothetical protein
MTPEFEFAETAKENFLYRLRRKALTSLRRSPTSPRRP